MELWFEDALDSFESGDGGFVFGVCFLEFAGFGVGRVVFCARFVSGVLGLRGEGGGLAEPSSSGRPGGGFGVFGGEVRGGADLSGGGGERGDFGMVCFFGLRFVAAGAF